MNPVTFPDAQLATLNVLRSSSYTPSGVTFGTLPQDTDTPHPLPYVSVRIDGAFPAKRVSQTATIRVSVWHSSESEGLALAQLLHGVLLAYAGDASVRSFGELTGPVPTEDPDTRAPLSYFTVAARLRPTTL